MPLASGHQIPYFGGYFQHSVILQEVQLSLANAFTQDLHRTFVRRRNRNFQSRHIRHDSNILLFINLIAQAFQRIHQRIDDFNKRFHTPIVQ